MHTTTRAVPILLLVSAMAFGPALAQTDHPAPSADPVMEDLVVRVEELARKMIMLAEAMPEEAYDWQPMEGVRSVGDVFVHIAGDNWWLPTHVGVQPPEAAGITADFATVRAYEARPVTKAEVIEHLEDSFQHIVEAMRGTPSERMEEPLTMFGQPHTVRSMWVLTTTHMHEHLGQSIAYARANRVKPPWSR
ncbi:MAG: DinB family protein [Gemmatimonadota bacterium]